MELVELFKSYFGLVIAWRSLVMERFNRNVIFGYLVSSIGYIIRRRLGDVVFYRVKFIDRFKELYVCYIFLFKDLYI